MRDSDFERLYAEHAQALLGFLGYQAGDAALAEDLLADTFERALRARRRFDPRRGSERAWLYSIAVNLVRDRARRAAAEGRALQAVTALGEAPAADWAAQLEDRDRVMRALSALSEEEREAVSLRFGAELTVPEIARVLGVRRSTAHGRVYRGLERLREEMG